jgi:hypothetical protein
VTEGTPVRERAKIAIAISFFNMIISVRRFEVSSRRYRRHMQNTCIPFVIRILPFQFRNSEQRKFIEKLQLATTLPFDDLACYN